MELLPFYISDIKCSKTSPTLYEKNGSRKNTQSETVVIEISVKYMRIFLEAACPN